MCKPEASSDGGLRSPSLKLSALPSVSLAAKQRWTLRQPFPSFASLCWSPWRVQAHRT